MTVDISPLTKIGTPWPESKTSSVHFILYAEEDFEFEFLEKWIIADKPANAAHPSLTRIALGEDDDTASLQPKDTIVDAQHDHVVVPVGVIWTRFYKDDDKSLKFRDFLMSDKLAPAKRKSKQKVLVKDPSRCVLLAGEAAQKSATGRTL